MPDLFSRLGEGCLGARRDLLGDIGLLVGPDAEFDHGVPVLLVEEVLVHRLDDLLNLVLWEQAIQLWRKVRVDNGGQKRTDPAFLSWSGATSFSKSAGI
jgi:hypothetical protein